MTPRRAAAKTPTDGGRTTLDPLRSRSVPTPARSSRRHQSCRHQSHGTGVLGELPSRAPSESGFSTVEALLAGALLLIMALGVLPMFTQALSNNRQGRIASDAANQARSELERLTQLTFDHAELTVPDGSDELTRTDHYSETKRIWINDSSWNDATDGFRLFTRDVTVRQYNFDALADELLDPTEAQAGGADPGLIHFKEILVEINALSLRVGPNKQVTMRAIKTI